MAHDTEDQNPSIHEQPMEFPMLAGVASAVSTAIKQLRSLVGSSNNPAEVKLVKDATQKIEQYQIDIKAMVSQLEAAMKKDARQQQVREEYKKYPVDIKARRAELEETMQKDTTRQKDTNNAFKERTAKITEDMKKAAENAAKAGVSLQFTGKVLLIVHALITSISSLLKQAWHFLARTEQKQFAQHKKDSRHVMAQVVDKEYKPLDKSSIKEHGFIKDIKSKGADKSGASKYQQSLSNVRAKATGDFKEVMKNIGGAGRNEEGTSSNLKQNLRGPGSRGPGTK